MHPVERVGPDPGLPFPGVGRRDPRRATLAIVVPTVLLQFILPGRRPLRQREWVRTHSHGREFSYAMKPLPLGALRSLRTQSIAPLADGRTRYTSHFELSGWLHPLVRLLLGARLRRGFHAMTASLATRAELG